MSHSDERKLKTLGIIREDAHTTTGRRLS